MARTLDAGMVVKGQVYCYETANTAQVAINTTYWLAGVQTGGATFTTEDFAEAFSGMMAPIYKDLMSSSASFSGVRCQVWRPKPIERAVVRTNEAGVGTRNVSLAPPQVAFVVTLLTAEAKVRGRQYIPFPSNADMDVNGTPDAAYLVNAAVYAAAIRQPLAIVKGASTLPMAPVVFSPQVPYTVTAEKPLVRNEFWTLIEDATTKDGFGTQRRRGFYGKINPPLAS